MKAKELLLLVNNLKEKGFEPPDFLDYEDGWKLLDKAEQKWSGLTSDQAVIFIGESVLRFIQRRQPMLSTGTHGDWYVRTGSIVADGGVVASVHWDLSPMEAVLALAQKLLDQKVFV